MVSEVKATVMEKMARKEARVPAMERKARKERRTKDARSLVLTRCLEKEARQHSQAMTTLTTDGRTSRGSMVAGKATTTMASG